MSTAEEILEEMQPDMVEERLARVEGMLKKVKVKLPDVVLANAVEGLRKIKEKLEKRLSVYESDFDFVEEVEMYVIIKIRYVESMEDLKQSGLYDPETAKPEDKKPPTEESVIKTLLSNLTMGQKEVIRKMKEPVLQIVPIRTISEYVKALNKNKTITIKRGQINAYVPGELREVIEKADIRDEAEKGKITGWRIVVTEGTDAPDLSPGMKTNEKLDTQLNKFNKYYAGRGVSGIDFKSYILLQISGLLKKPTNPVDIYWGGEKHRTKTMLNGESIEREKVVIGSWWGDTPQIALELGPLWHTRVENRFRPTIMIKI